MNDNELPRTFSLDSRKRKILKAIIDDYVRSCEPVGSKKLVEEYNLGVSPATVRNEMAELEALGYLEQPHTSAGRIPSDKGYRAYVDEMMTLDPLSSGDQQRIREYIESSLGEVTELIRRATAALAQQTEYTSLALTPHYSSSSLKQVRILMIEPGRALIVLVLSAGVVRDRMVRVPEYLTATDLQRIATAVEEAVSGRKLDDITLISVTEAVEGTEIPESLLNQVLFETYVSIKQAENIDVYMEGSHRLLKQPEFSDVEKAHRFMDALSRDGLVAGYMREIRSERDNEAEDSRFMVRIGQEIALSGLEDCSFITTSYSLGDQIHGRIGVVGPKRMLYGKVIADISFVNRTLSHEIKRLAGLSGNKED